MNKPYLNTDLSYCEKAIAMEEFYIHEPGIIKFHIPGITPFIGGGEPKDNSTRISKNHLINKDKGNINSSNNCTLSNYVEIELPNWITAVIRDIVVKVESKCTGGVAPDGGGQCSPGAITNTVEVERLYFFPIDDREYVAKGYPFMVAFIGGDVNKKQIVGRYK